MRLGHKRLRREIVKAGSDHSPSVGFRSEEAWDGSKQVLSRKEEAGMTGGMQPATEVEYEPGLDQSRRS